MASSSLRIASGLVVAAAVALFVSPLLQGQERAKPASSSASESGTKTAATRKPAKGRLPAFYGEVITEEQREKIYALQAKHRPEIERLKAELQALLAKQQDETEAVLTSEQKAKVASLRDAAQKKRAEKLASEETDDVIKKAQTTDNKPKS